MSIDQLSLIGGHFSLDFVNTAGEHLSDHPGEWLRTYLDLVAWALRAGVITNPEALGLRRRASRQSDLAESALSRAITMRETIYRLFLSVIRFQPPDPADLSQFNRSLAQTPARSALVYSSQAYHWQLAAENDRLDWILWRVMWGAADLLASDRLEQLKMCAGDHCGWLFLDVSRNRSRRWCSMADCGNRSKATRFYQRHK